MKHKHWPSAAAGCVVITLAMVMGVAWAQEVAAPQIDLGAPQNVTDKDFENVKASSPFTRSLNLSDSLMLTGVMNIGDRTTATVIDKETKELYVVSDQTNPQGWRMVAVEGDRTDLEKLTAKIAVAGGEVVTVRFDDKQLKPEGVKAAGAGGKKDGRGPGGGGHHGPPPEVMAKLRSLTSEQQTKLREHMGRMRSENPDMSREQMRDNFYKAVDRLQKSSGGGDKGGGR